MVIWIEKMRVFEWVKRYIEQRRVKKSFEIPANGPAETLCFRMHSRYCHQKRKQWWIHPTPLASSVWILHSIRTMVSNFRVSHVCGILLSCLSQLENVKIISKCHLECNEKMCSPSRESQKWGQLKHSLWLMICVYLYIWHHQLDGFGSCEIIPKLFICYR